MRPSDSEANQHPSVIFDIIARDQEKKKRFYTAVFGWSYKVGTDGFAYVHYPVHDRSQLCGIRQVQLGVPGFEPGHNFYLLVDSLEITIEKAVAAGGVKFVEPAKAMMAGIPNPSGPSTGPNFQYQPVNPAG